MTNAQLATASLDDIVFDGRNRQYGAYQLRASYQRHMTRALIIATALFALLMVFPLLAHLLKSDVVISKTGPVLAQPEIFDLPQPAVTPATPPPAAQRTPPPSTPTVKNLIPVVAKDDKVTKPDEVPNQQELENKQSGVRNIEGDPNAAATIPDDVPVGPASPPTDDLVNRIYISVEKMPELPTGGGTMGIVAAIQKVVRYPSQALRNGVEGRVFVSFTVNQLGDVTDLKIVKGLGYGLDEETMRAIKTLPRFIPGKQNGRDVSVSFTVPVTYRIQ